MLMFGRDFESWNLIKICVGTCYFGKQNSTLGSVVPLAMLKLQRTLECRQWVINAQGTCNLKGQSQSLLK